MIMYKILKLIKKCLNGWKPSDIFYSDTTFVSVGLSTYRKCYTYTTLGKWFNSMPYIVSLLKVVYYIHIYPVYIVTKTLWFTIELFLPFYIKRWL